MQRIDLHLHLTPWQLPKLGKMNLTSAKNMLPHLDELHITKGVLMSSTEKGLPFGTNKANRAICTKHPERYVWMCVLTPDHPETVYDRLKAFKSQGAIGVGELAVNRRLDDPFLQVLFAAAEKLDMPVLFHMSPEVGYSYGVVDDPGLPPAGASAVRLSKAEAARPQPNLLDRNERGCPHRQRRPQPVGQRPCHPRRKSSGAV